MATKKKLLRVGRRKITVWFSREREGDYTNYEVHPRQPRSITRRDRDFGGNTTFITSKEGRTSRYDNGSVTELCSKEVAKTLGLNLRAGEALPVTFTFGKVVKL